MNDQLLKQNIPNGWGQKALSELVFIKKGEQLNKLAMDDSGQYPALNGGVSPSGYTDKWNTEANTITISEGGNSCGYVNFNWEKFWCGGHCYALLDLEENIDNSFLYQALKSRQGQLMKLRVGSGLPNIQKRSIEEFSLLFPKSKTEQQKIAEILGTVDEDIAKTQEVIETTEKLKRGLMQQLFTRGIGHTKFKETKIGRIPEGWSLVQIKDAPIKIADGNYSAKYPRQDEFMEEGIPFVRVNNLQDQTLVKEDLKYISVEKHSELKKGHLKTDDVLITTRGRLGVIALVPSEFNDANINAQIVLLRADNKNLLSKFLMYFLLSPEFQSQVFSGGSGSALQQLPVRVLENTYIPLPSPKEQLEIAEIFSSVDEKISVNKKLKEKLTLLKKGLMQDLLSGRVRVNKIINRLG